MTAALLRAAALLSILAPPPALAATRTATAATLARVWERTRAGDTIVLKGDFPETRLRQRRFAAAVGIDARAARFPRGLSLVKVGNVRLTGGTYGSLGKATRGGTAIVIEDSRAVAITGATVLGVRRHGNSKGILVTRSQGVRIAGGDFRGMKIGISIADSRDGRLTGNAFVAMASDGINIASGRNILASGNRCTAFVPLPGAHPDCIQLWSKVGGVQNADITLDGNRAIGSMQGFTSFNPGTGATRLTFTDNHAEVDYPHGIACYACTDSRFFGNTLVTPAGARWATRLNIVGGHGNVADGNVFIDRRSPGRRDSGWTATPWLEADGALMAAVPIPGLDDAQAVPEPAGWAQLVAGLGLLGTALRRRRPAPAPIDGAG